MSSRIPTSYADYLKSEDWRQTRQRALYRAQDRCQSPLCRLAYLRSLTDAELREEITERLPRHAYLLEVHHLTYERLGREHPDDLIVLCPACHAAAHGLEHTDKPRMTSMDDALAESIRRMTREFGADPDA